MAFCKFSNHYELEIKAIYNKPCVDLHQVLEQTSTLLLALSIEVWELEFFFEGSMR